MTSRETHLRRPRLPPGGQAAAAHLCRGRGLHEHGQKLLDLIHACGHDFGPLMG